MFYIYYITALDCIDVGETVKSSVWATLCHFPAVPGKREPMRQGLWLLPGLLWTLVSPGAPQPVTNSSCMVCVTRGLKEVGGRKEKPQGGEVYQIGAH